MESRTPRLWPYSPSNSPVALPKESIFFCSSEIIPLQYPTQLNDSVLAGQALQAYCAGFTSNSGTVDELLASHDAPPMQERRPFLLLGELANPYRLQDIGIGPLPIYTVRLSGLCRTYADAFDNREVKPGVHHVTLARTSGWWEKSHLALATIDQMKQMVTWLDQGRRGSWKPVKPAEGMLHFETQELMPPTIENIIWDGHVESVEIQAPDFNGSQIDLKQVMVPIHANYGCYDNRGRLARCVHIGQRKFHDTMFRRGASKKWADILDIC
tara:strand:+ start:92 stop:901 length:810 start_codon:yes stop_codon:yes gene_type:complete